MDGVVMRRWRKEGGESVRLWQFWGKHRHKEEMLETRSNSYWI